MNIFDNDTICAIATATGGAIGLIRVSGPEAIDITSRVFSRDIRQSKTHTIHFGTIVDPTGSVVDEVLVSVFRSPHSYTGEESVEISCHGSRYILGRILQLLIDSGCRQARGGEFTQRAFANGKLDLSQAEAVADLISSTNQSTHRMAISQLRGSVSTSLAQLRDQLLKMTSLMELELDFSDHEELEFADRTELRRLAEEIDSQLTRLISSFASGKAVKQGIPVALVGKTNVGKSTLLNRLVGEERAIVSDIHGTTRDVIEDTVDINGVTFRFIDTAGLRHTDDAIEQIGIRLTLKKLDEAAVVVWIVDTPPAADDISDMLARTKKSRLIVAANKSDTHPSLSSQLTLQLPTVPVVSISARYGTNVDHLLDAIYRAADIPSISANDVIITSSRHYDSLCRARASIRQTITGLDLGLSGDLLSEDLRQCLDSIAEVTGRGIITSTEVLTNIFSHFCIGK